MQFIGVILIIGIIGSVYKNYPGVFWGVIALAVVLFIWLMAVTSKEMEREKEEVNALRRRGWKDGKPFKGTIAPVQNEQDKWGFVDSANRIIVPLKYREVEFFCEGGMEFWRCSLWRPDMYEYVDTQGAFVEPEKAIASIRYKEPWFLKEEPQEIAAENETLQEEPEEEEEGFMGLLDKAVMWYEGMKYLEMLDDERDYGYSYDYDEDEDE